MTAVMCATSTRRVGVLPNVSIQEWYGNPMPVFKPDILVQVFRCKPGAVIVALRRRHRIIQAVAIIIDPGKRRKRGIWVFRL